ncbi:murein biosynthesis integral membrane protein MurJ [Pseudoluteimonas lycopersici]|uniref:Probable lipid II flippase MurJ n=1 Tax=Pseudoluteimonas lycopersici TaxID=1324796 RepID=A0A516V3W9_9GAMM|nr:murein biosynthesis integral membrane protein MurJ [Lysobacter lycopersici]QDQ73225.1 murein biosynthesis integral membrane protein MurJ [Lysobacter lycopersici]
MARGILSFGGMTMLSRVFGLVRDISFNAAFGAGPMTDAFWVAFRIPNFMRRLFAEGSFSTAFVPVFIEIKEKRSHDELKALVARTSGTLGGVLLVVTALGMLLAPWFADAFSNNVKPVAGQHELIIHLLRWTFPFLLFISLTALSAGALNSYQRFGLPALAPIILNLCMIAGAWWGAKLAHPPIMAMGWAVLAAGILQLLFLMPALAKLDLLALPRWGWSHPDVRKVMRLMVPTLIGSSVAQINLLFDTFVASKLAAGSQSWLSAADRFLELPLGVFGIALGTVILPTLARHHVNTDRAGFSKSLDWGLRSTLIIIIPAMLGLMTLSVPLVATIFQHGKFDEFATRMAALSVFGLSFGLPAFALVKTVLPAFYARQDTHTPMRAGITALIANMVFTALLLALLYSRLPASARTGGWVETLATHPGLHFALGLASALSSYLNLILLWRWLRKAGVYDAQPGWSSFLWRVAIANLAMAAFLLVGLHFAPDFTLAPPLARIAWLGILVAGGGLVYGLAMLALGFRPRDFREH